MKRIKRYIYLTLCVGLSTVSTVSAENLIDPSVEARPHLPTREVKKILRETDPDFFKTEEAARIGEQLMLWQRSTGGWPKNIDMVSPMSDAERANVMAEKERHDDSTTDNDATNMQMRFLARLYKATGDESVREAFNRGVDYLLSGQYDNGGWPQFWPEMHDYQVHITYNDNAMVNTMMLLRDIASGSAPFDSDLCDDKMRKRLKEAFDRGVECILATQIVVDGQLTVWCQQHDRETFAPAKARAYELPSYCSQESAAIVRLLMEIPNPDQRIIDAVDGAMRWFEDNRVKDVTYIRTNETGKWEAKLIPNPKDDTPIWARFYDLENCQPFVCDRDGVPRRNLEEIGDERRNNYAWYSDAPAALFPIYREWKTNH